MFSSDNNINPPLRKFQMDANGDNLYDPKMVEYITQDIYDKMFMHDPHTAYVITDGTDCKVYYGDTLERCDIPGIRSRFMISINSHGNYVVWFCSVLFNKQEMTPLGEYEDPQAALNKLAEYSRIGSYSPAAANIYKILGSYIEKDIGIHEAIVGIISLMRYRDNPEIQYLNELAVKYNVAMMSRDISNQLRILLHNKRSHFPNSSVSDYSDIYDIFVEYQMFTGREYQNKDVSTLDLSMPIKKIMNVFFLNRKQ